MRQKIAMLGDTGAGKTCFIAVLQWLGEEGDPFHNIGTNGETKKYLDQLFNCFCKGELPEGTDRMHRLSFPVRFAAKDHSPVTIDFDVYDYQGSDLARIEDSSELFQIWAACDVLLVMIDAEKVRTKNDLLENLRGLRSVLTRPSMDASTKSLAIVLTKSDMVGFSTATHAPEDARDFVEQNIEGFIGTINEMGFRNWRCFALASLGVTPNQGADGICRIPLSRETRKPDIRPFGYEELFGWLSDIQPQIELLRILHRVREFWRRFHRPVTLVAATLAMLLAVTYAVLAHRWNEAESVWRTGSTEEKAKATWRMRGTLRAKVIDERIGQHNEGLQKAGKVVDKIRRLIDDNTNFWSAAKLSEKQRCKLNEIEETAKRTVENVMVEDIANATENKNLKRAEDLIAAYRDDRLILHSRSKDVNGYESIVKSKKIDDSKREIACFDVGVAGNSERMKEKINKVLAFEYPSGDETVKKEAKQAAEIMNNLLDKGTFKITQIQVGRLDGTRDIYVKIATEVGSGCDLKDVGCLETHKKNGVVGAQWDTGAINNDVLSWRPGQSIRVEWRRNRTWGKDKAYAWYECGKNDWLGLLRMLQKKCSMSHPGNHTNFSEPPWMSIKCKVFDDPKRALDLVEEYIQPGNYWKR